MGGSSKSDTHQVQNNQINPAQMQQYQQNYTDAQSRLGSLTPYQGQLTAGFNPNQIQAQGILSGVATDPTYAANNNSAISSVQGVLGSNTNPAITPMGITSPTISAGQLAGKALSPYMNPFTDSVINTSVDQNERARQMQRVTDQQHSTMAGAFGGSRAGVADSLTNGEYDRNAQSLISNLNLQNFNQAQQGAIGDINRTMTADQFNAGNSLAAQQFNSGQNVNTQQQSFANALAQQGLKLNAAGQLEQLNNNGLSLAAQQGGILSAVGDAQQQQQQSEFSNAYNAYLQGQQLTLAQQQALNQALGIIPIEQTNTTDGTTTTKTNPGLLNTALGIGSLGLGFATGGASMGLTGLLGGAGSGAAGGLFGIGKAVGSGGLGEQMGWT